MLLYLLLFHKMNMKNSLSFIWCMCVKFSSWNQMNSEQRTFIQCAKFACIVHNQYNFISTTLFYIYIYYIHIQFNNVGTKGEREREGESKRKRNNTVCVVSFLLIFFSVGFSFARVPNCTEASMLLSNVLLHNHCHTHSITNFT